MHRVLTGSIIGSIIRAVAEQMMLMYTACWACNLLWDLFYL